MLHGGDAACCVSTATDQSDSSDRVLLPVLLHVD